ncbi:MAG TPA: apolipoprotein N-acyltransferase [Mycobacteriales bacterium]|nr:apolipoprotein N-acyltransferase [Mycobacteriales bacterium]
MNRRLARAGAAVAAGVAVWVTFPPLGFWPAGLVGVAGLALVLRAPASRRWTAVLGYLFGLGLWVPLLSFLRGYGLDAWFGLAAIESLWFLGLALALRVVLRGRWWPLTSALVWVGQEFLRDRVPWQGFPWGRLAFGQANSPLVHLAAIGGAPLVTFAVALGGGALAYVAATRRPSVRTLAAVAAVALVVAGPLAISLPTGGTSRGGAPSSVVVAAIQGNVPRLGLDAFAQRHAVTANHAAETELLARRVAAGAAPKPDFVVWPENSDDLDPRVDAQSRQDIEAAASAIGVPMLVGAVLDGPGPNHVQNAGIVWSPTTGPGQIYVKRHLVPFGEYLPFRGVLTRLFPKFKLIAKDFVPGHRPGVLRIGGTTIGDTICFEIADDTVVRQAITGGGRLLVVQTNNASYEHKGDSGYGGETAQQLAIARLRAVEHGRAVVVAATSGVSAMIAPNGQVLARTGVFEPAYLDRRLPLRDPLTIADRVGAWPEWILSVAGLLALLAGLIRRRGRSTGESLDLQVRQTYGGAAGAQPVAR